MKDLEGAAELGVFVLEGMVAVWALGDDLCDTVFLEGLYVLLAQGLEYAKI